MFNAIKAGIPNIAPRGTRAGDMTGVVYGASSLPRRRSQGEREDGALTSLRRARRRQRRSCMLVDRQPLYFAEAQGPPGRRYEVPRAQYVGLHARRRCVRRLLWLVPRERG